MSFMVIQKSKVLHYYTEKEIKPKQLSFLLLFAIIISGCVSTSLDPKLVQSMIP